MPPIQLQKAQITSQDGTSLTCAFNPKQVTLSTGAEWKREATRSANTAPPAQFKGTKPRSVQMELFFDQNWPDYSGRHVESDIQQLLDWTCPTQASRGSNQPNPPTLTFHWGTSTFATFSAYLESVSVTFSLFSEQGVPIRASASCTFAEVPDQAGRQNPSSGGVPGRRTHVLRAGDSLHSIAQHEYGKPAFWRGLADANGIDDPLRVPIGTTILVPPADDVEARS
jgi:nucleoid-associated protein YgaU